MDRVLPIPAYIASLAPKDAEDARRLVARVPTAANAIEFRMDLAERPIPPPALLGLDPRPVILTWRSLAEGGNFSGAAEEYARLVEEGYAAGATVDVEHARGLLSDPGRFPERDRVIVSLHSPFSLPADWDAKVSAMRQARARAVKLVAGVADVAGSLRIAELQRDARDGAAAIFPMGPASAPGRVLSALFGAALVYGPVERETAPGQVPIGDLLSIYEVNRPRPLEALYGVSPEARRGRFRRSCTTPSSGPAIFRISTFRSRCPTSAAERPHEIAFDPPVAGLRRDKAVEARGGAGRALRRRTCG